jgi:hypothetical protein
MVGEPGLEPGTSASRTQRATRLRYSPLVRDSVAKPSSGSPLAGAPFGFGPRFFQVVQRTAGQAVPASLAGDLLYGLKAGGELAVGRPQGFFGIDAVLPGQLGQNVEQVAQLLAPFGERARLQELGQLFAHFVERAVAGRPIETRPGRFARQLGGAFELGQALGYAVQR